MGRLFISCQKITGVFLIDTTVGSAIPSETVLLGGL